MPLPKRVLPGPGHAVIFCFIASLFFYSLIASSPTHGFEVPSAIGNVLTGESEGAANSGDAPSGVPAIPEALTGPQDSTLEIVAINPVADFVQQVSALGFPVNDAFGIPTLDLDISFLGLPDGLPIAAALSLLRDSFSGIVADQAAVYELAGTEDISQRYWQEIIGWQSPPAACGQGARIGIIDGGVDETTGLFGANYTYRDFTPSGFNAGAVDHGTAVLALLAAQPDQGQFGGLLPGAEYFSANIFHVDDNRTIAGMRSLLRAIGWLLSQEVQVINMSFAGPNNAVFSTLVRRITNRGIITVAAAGNEGPGTLLAPTMFSEVIGVAAVDENLQPYALSSDIKQNDFSAPGVDIWTLTPQGGRLQTGTSFAAPFVTAVIGYMKARNPALTGSEIRDNLGSSVTDAGAPGPDARFGYGVIRANHNCR